MEAKIHEGRNVKRFREWRGIKQEALADMLGADWSQKKISQLEQKETIDNVILEEVARALQFPVEAFRTYDEDKPVNIVGNTFQDFKDNASAINLNPVFNPVETILKLHEEKMELYERMLKEKAEMIEILKKLIEEKK